MPSPSSSFGTSDPSAVTPDLRIEVRLTLARPAPNKESPLDITLTAYGPERDGSYRAAYYTRDRWTRGEGLTKEMIGERQGAIRFVQEMLDASRSNGATVLTFKWNGLHIDHLSGIA